MKRDLLRFSVIALLILTIIGVSFACLPPTASSTPSALTTVQERLTKAEQDITRKADIGQFQAHEERIKKLETAPAPAVASSGYTKAETYTKAEVDKAVNDAIKALKDNQTWITAQTTTPYSSYNPLNPYGPTVPTSPTGQVTWSTSPPQLPTIFSGASGITCTGTTFSVTPTGYVQPYTMRITNTSPMIQYVRPIITISMATTGGYYYGGIYPQLIYFNVSISTGYGMVQGTATSNFCGTSAPIAPCTQASCTSLGFTNCTTPFNGFCPITGFATSSTTNPTGGFPINLSPSNANTQPSPSFSFTPTAPSLNGYGEFQMTPGQSMDILITIQIATLQQATLQISNSISARQ